MTYRHGGNIAWAAEKFNLKLEDFVDFSSNTNPLGPPPGLAEVFDKHLNLIKHYPDPDCDALKEIGSRFFNVSPNQITFANGANELIYLILQVLAPGKVAIPGPTFREYERAARAWKAQIKHLRLTPNNQFLVQPASLFKTVKKTDLIFLCNPNNPTGQMLPPEVLKNFLDYCCKKEIIVVVDESYLLFNPKWRELTCIPAIKHQKNLLVLHSLTKIFCVPGIRLGCALAHHDLLKRFSSYQLPWRVNSIAQAVAEKALTDKNDYLQISRHVINRERKFLYDELSLFPGFKVFPSEANFLLVELKKPLSATFLENELGKKGILIRNCNNLAFLDERFIRIAVKQHHENELLLKGVRQIIGGDQT